MNTATVLDPTCGSGAFLFAALNILQPLYEGCLDRMEAFVAEADQAKASTRHADFRRVLAQIKEHPNRDYFILKSIIIGNLYGVDIMEEATEICKLRLFLKLAAQVERDENKPNYGLEPLPDIDFNIRAGNTLVGFTDRAAVDAAFAGEGQGKFDFENKAEQFNEDAEAAERAFEQFRLQQTRLGGDVTLKDKAALRGRLKKLSDKLDVFLAHEYGVNTGKPLLFEAWRKSHQPFHWYSEFFGIINSGGFDVAIGNPPYIVYAPGKINYSLEPQNYTTLPTKNLYAFVFERSLKLVSKASRIGLIVQLTSLSSERLPKLQDLLLSRSGLTALPFPRRPESIFDGVEMPVAIILSAHLDSGKFTTSRVNRFYTEEREHALASMALTTHSIRIDGYRIAKIGLELEKSIYQKFTSSGTMLGVFAQSNSSALVYYQEACRYWVKATYGQPFFKRNGIEMEPPHGRTISFRNQQAAALAACLLNSSLFYWFYSAFADCEHINDGLVRDLRIPEGWESTDWFALSKRLAKSLSLHARRKTMHTKQGHKIEYDEIKALHSKSIIDEIDFALAHHYGFTEEESDFIINYDIKYRMGRDSEE